MFVSELIRLLQDLPQDAVVLQSRDGEGNRILLLDSVSTEWYWPGTEYDAGEVVCQEDVDEEDKDSLVKSVVLWPVD